MRKQEVLSMTTAPALAARGANAAETLLPGDDSTISGPRKSRLSSAWIRNTSSSPNDTSRPTKADEGKATTSSTGNWRSASVVRISRPTLPVAPTTATLKPISGTPGLVCGLGSDWLLTYDAGQGFTSVRRACRAV